MTNFIENFKEMDDIEKFSYIATIGLIQNAIIFSAILADFIIDFNILVYVVAMNLIIYICVRQISSKPNHKYKWH